VFDRTLPFINVRLMVNHYTGITYTARNLYIHNSEIIKVVWEMYKITEHP